jgi:hypothetical protein
MMQKIKENIAKNAFSSKCKIYKQICFMNDGVLFVNGVKINNISKNIDIIIVMMMIIIIMIIIIIKNKIENVKLFFMTKNDQK